MEICNTIDTDNDHVSSYHVFWHILHLTAYYYYSGRAVLIVLLMEEEEGMVGRQFNNFEELESSA